MYTSYCGKGLLTFKNIYVLREIFDIIPVLNGFMDRCPVYELFYISMCTTTKIGVL